MSKVQVHRSYSQKTFFQFSWNAQLCLIFMKVLTKTRNDLKRPETTWNDLQRARNDMKWPLTRKKRPETTHNEKDTTYNHLNIPTTSKGKTRNDQEQADFQIILQYEANGSLLWYVLHPTFGYSHSSIASQRIMVKTERQASIIMQQASIIMRIFYGI